MSEFEFVYDLTPKEVQVTLNGELYVLSEATEDAERRSRNKMFEGVTLGEGGKPQGIRGLADADSLLLSLCIYRLIKDETEEKRIPIPHTTILTWPRKVVKALSDKVKKMSDMDVDDETKTLEERLAVLEERAKNVPSDTLTG